MLRYVVATPVLFLALSVLPAHVPDPAADTVCPAASVEATYLCVTLDFSVSGSEKHEWVVIDWGDGSTDGVDCPRVLGDCSLAVPHTYDTPGTYTIEVTALSGSCPGSTRRVLVDVADAPALDIHAVAEGDSWVQPGTSDPLDTGILRRSTVDWGDGSPVEEFAWVACAPGVLCMPRHDYAADGTYTITTRVEYLGAWEGTCYERVSVIDIEIGSTASEATTWGIVKSRYR